MRTAYHVLFMILNPILLCSLAVDEEGVHLSYLITFKYK